MELLVFGHGGQTVLVFPTSEGRFYDCEDRGMAEALGGALEGGRVPAKTAVALPDRKSYIEQIHEDRRTFLS